MDYELDEDQRAIVGAVESLLDKHAGAARARALEHEGGYDHALHEALLRAGFFGVAHDVDLLAAALVAETVARRAGVVSYGETGIVLPGLGSERVDVPVCLLEEGTDVALFAPHATHAIALAGDLSQLYTLTASDVHAEPTSFGYPIGRVKPRTEPVRALGSAQRARALARLAISAECVGTMEAALELTVGYVSQRFQFGRAIGSFQAVQHRLALAKVALEGARALTYEAAFHDADPERVATAAAYATQAAQRVHQETHQLTGALGFTREHDLYVWSMRLQALRLRLGGTSGHRRALAQARWGVSA